MRMVKVVVMVVIFGLISDFRLHVENKPFLLPFFREEKMDTLITVECSRSLAVLH